MTKFKVGDKVRRTKHLVQEPHSGWPSFEEGKVYEVNNVSPSGAWLGIQGMPYHLIRPYDAKCFELAPYSSYFTEQRAEAEPTTGHVADSPMQKHSKGEFYPLCVVGYSDIGRMAYTIENLEQGTVLGFVPGEFKGGSNIRAWSSAAAAYKFLTELPEVAESEWVKGRPTFIKNSLGLEIAMMPKHKRWMVTLDKVDLTGEVVLINGVYYKALEQDIG